MPPAASTPHKDRPFANGYTGTMARQQQTKDQGRLEPRFFVIGCISFGAAIVLALSTFALRELSQDQREVVRWCCSLAAGFAAGSFAGSLTVKSTGVVPGLIISATGGFGVFLLVFFFLFRSPVDPRPPLHSLACSGTTTFQVFGEVNPPKCFKIGFNVRLVDRFGRPLPEWSPARETGLGTAALLVDSVDEMRIRKATGEAYPYRCATYRVEWSRTLINTAIAVAGSSPLANVAATQFECGHIRIGRACEPGEKPFEDRQPDLIPMGEGTLQVQAMDGGGTQLRKLLDTSGKRLWSQSGPGQVLQLSGPVFSVFVTHPLR